ncbi:type IV toxin-antitoxin system AbiEi family antitoxin domain-containing protein [Frankia canadensis]|nr:type IV toxin-antitoxin system AbiEi family antitoxin domain-containing protein [Frankia canadensis]
MTSSTSASTQPTRPVIPLYPGLDPAIAVARRQGGMITFRQAIAAGLTRGQLRQLVHSGQWNHPVRGAFVVPGAQGCPPLRLAGLPAVAEGPAGPRPTAEVEALPVVAAGPVTFPPPPFPLAARARAALVGRPQAVVCGVSAARLLGFPAADSDSAEEPVHLMLPPKLTRAQPRGIRLHFTELGADERIELDGIPLTSPARTLADLVLSAPAREAAVAEMDAALRGGLVRDLQGAQESAQGRRGFRTVLRWWPLADGRAESALETRLRLLLTDAGLAPPHLQWPVTDAAGEVVARLDLAWPRHRLDVEADTWTAASSAGVVHHERQRGNALAALRWTVLRFSALDVAWHPERIVAAVGQVLAGNTGQALRAS